MVCWPTPERDHLPARSRTRDRPRRNSVSERARNGCGTRLSQHAPTPTDPLIHALKRARRSWWRGALERTAVVATIAATGVPVAAWPVRWWTGAAGPGWSDANLAPTLALMLATFLAVTLGLTVAYALRAPTLLTLARRCDHALGQRQRLSTAFEVLQRHGRQPDSVVMRLLLEDVDRRLPALDLAPAVRSRTPRPLLSTLVAVSVTAGAAFAVPVPEPRTAPVADPGPSAPTTAGASLTPDSRDETIALAEQIAEQLAAEPLADRDPFLRAVADGFADLAVQLSEDAISVAEADQIVEDLLAFLDDAVGRTGGSLEDVVREAMPEGIDRGRGEDSNATIPSIGAAGDEEQGREAAAVNDDRPLAPGGSDSAGSTLERLAEALERRAEERAASGLDAPAEAFSGDGSNPYGDQVNVVRESSGDAQPGAEPLLRADADAAGAGRAAGAAQQSSAGGGDAAGAGSAELTGDGGDFERDDAQAELTPIEAGDQADGRRIESSFAPTEGAPLGRAVTDEPEARAFDRARESGTPSRPLGWTHRDVVVRYFLPDEAANAADTNP